MQLILILALAGVSFLVYGKSPALAALYGGGIALINSLLMIRRVSKANKVLSKDPRSDVVSLYLGALERFVFTFAAMALGMGWLGINPLALLAGFALAHFAYPLSKGLLPANS